jgi:SnoaL-like domain
MFRGCLALALLGLSLLFVAHITEARRFNPKDPRVEDRLAIMDLITQYCSAVDQRDVESFKDVFTKDALLDYSANGFVGKGSVDKMQKEIFDGLAPFQISVHRTTNMEIEFTGPREAKVRVMLDNPMYIFGFPVFPIATIHAYYNHIMVKDQADELWRSKTLSMEVFTFGHTQAIALVVFFVLLYRTRRAVV